jgi:hypothetical protein
MAAEVHWKDLRLPPYVPNSFFYYYYFFR